MNELFNSFYDALREDKINSLQFIDKLNNLKEELFQPTYVYAYSDPFVQDHLVEGKPVVLGVTHISIALNELSKSLSDSTTVSLRDVTFNKPIVLEDKEKVSIKFVRSERNNRQFFTAEYQKGNSDWKQSASGVICSDTDLNNLMTSCKTTDVVEDIDSLFDVDDFVIFGPSHKIIKELSISDDISILKLELNKDILRDRNQYLIHPLIISSSFIGILPALLRNNVHDSYLPIGIKRIKYYKQFESLDSCKVCISLDKITSEMILFDADYLDNTGKIVLQLRGCSMKKIHKVSSENQSMKDDLIPVNNKVDYICDYLGNLVKSTTGKGIDKKHYKNNLMDYGIESAKLIDIVEKLEQNFSIELNPTIMFEYPSIFELSAYLNNEYPDLYKSVIKEDSKLSAEKPSLLLNDHDENMDFDNKNIDLNSKLNEYISGLVLKISGKEIRKNDYKTNLMDFGIESSQLINIVELIEKELSVELNPTVLFEYPSIKELSDYIIQTFFEKIKDRFSINKPSEGNSIIEEKISVSKENSIKVNDINLCVNNFSNNSGHEPMAIIGISAILPESDDIEQFWQNLLDCKDMIKVVPKDHFDVMKWYSSDPKKKNMTYSKWGSFIDDVDKFDAEFFSISPREAEWMDPQIRLLLQNVYNAVENAGYINKFRHTNTGVFVGACFHDYEDKISDMNIAVGPYLGTGNASTVISNRVSFFFDLKGPSLTMDTACSSSLVALNQACYAIQRNECKMAIVSGVNLLLDSAHYRYFSSLGALSPNGRCNTFDKCADGYVPGECIASLVIKPLNSAIKDNDNIYGVIKGSVVLHGGYTPSLTAPSVAGEKNLILRAWANAGVDPRTISYVECHGTGTKLGDPIEVESLTKAFKEFTDDKHFCALGSVKANVGHTEGAAGVLGVIKVLLQFKHHLIPKLPFFETLNPYIKLNNSAVYINDSISNWNNDNGPLRAGVSAFGFSGTYAHVVLEEYCERIVHNNTSENTMYVVPISAASKELLKKIASKLLCYLEANEERNFREIVYSLQCCKEEMKYRLFFIASNVHELIDKINYYIDNNLLKDSYNQVDFNCEELSELSNSDEIISCWMNGDNINWSKIYDYSDCFVLDIPVYPFAKKRYWINEKHFDDGYSAKLHPLIHENKSTIDSQCYHSMFSGNEFFLQGHIVQGKPVLPGVAYLEMARFIISDALKNYLVEDNSFVLHDIIWIRPLIFESDDLIIHTYISQVDENEYSFKIISVKENNEIVHCQGKISIEDNYSVDLVDINSLVSNCTLREVTREYCYGKIKEIGISYSDELMGITKIYKGKNYIMVKLDIPDGIYDNFDDYYLNPGIMDSSIQSAIALSDERAEDILTIPFSLQRLHIYSRCKQSMWARVEYACDPCNGDEGFSYNIDLFDDKGNKCIEFINLCTRKVELNADEKELFYSKSLEVLDDSLISDLNNKGKYIIFALGVNISISDVVKYSDVYTLSVDEYMQEPDKFITSYYKTLKTLSYEPNTVLSFINNEYHEFAESIRAINKVFDNEISSFTYKVIEIEDKCLSEVSDDYIEKCIKYPYNYLFYNSSFYREKWSLTTRLAENNYKYKDGVYVLTGGGGKIAQLVAIDISKNTKNAVIILLGRRKNNNIELFLKNIEENGTKSAFYVTDVTDYNCIKNTIDNIIEKYGAINNVFHLAGVTDDNLIANKSPEEFLNVLKPKISGIINLDHATKDLQIDCFVAFSSISAVIGAIGQVDYAAANAFMDGFIKKRNSLVDEGKRYGTSISINWSLWKNGGMKLNNENIKRMNYMYGIKVLENDVALSSLRTILNNSNENYLAVCGEERIINDRLITLLNSSIIIDSNKDFVEIDDDSLVAVQKWLIHIIHDITKLPEEGFNINEKFGQLGLDSIAMTELSSELSNKLQVSITPVVFFENPSVVELSSFLYRTYKSNLTKILSHSSLSNVNEINVRNNDRKLISKVIPKEKVDNFDANNKDIAIIGMSCSFPMADNIEEYWENLISGRNCISEVPKNRWDWKEYYGDPLKEKNKTRINKAGFINDIDKFDPMFFGISPKEATYMDPVQRLLMMHIWKAIEDSGYTSEMLDGTSTGIFTAIASSGYTELHKKADVPIEAYTSTSISSSIAANRMSYLLNLHGPSEPMETACSSSLISLQRAMQCIYDGDCSMAIVGGINLFVEPSLFISFDKAGMLSPDAKCKTFSKFADGYARGEGVGAVVIKLLKDAEKDNDNILAVIKSASINHGGKANTFTSPNPEAQKNVIKSAYEKANIPVSSVSYIETHGTGTAIGDPIEISALKNVFECDSKIYDSHFCGLGSVKSNIGHTELAAGMASLIKVILQLKNKTLVPSINCDELNPYIDLDNSPFYIVKEAKKWENLKDSFGNVIPLRAGISGFSFGGVNAHIILEEYNQENITKNNNSVNKEHYFVFSAKSKNSLRNRFVDFLKYLKENYDVFIDDLELNLAYSRDHMKYRCVIIADSIDSLISKIEYALNSDNYYGVISYSNSVDVGLKNTLEKWAKGNTIDFQSIYKTKNYRKLHLPTYSFDNKSYWLTDNFNEKQKNKNCISEITDEYHILEAFWNKIDSNNRKTTEINKKVLIGFKNGELFNSFKADKNYELFAIESFIQNFDYNKVINGDTELVFVMDNLWKRYDEFNKVVDVQSEGLYHLFDIIKSFYDKKLNKINLKITIITNYSIKTLESDNVNPTNSALHGFFGSIAEENKYWKIRCVDIDSISNFSEILNAIPFDAKKVYSVREGALYEKKYREIKAKDSFDEYYNRNSVFVIVGGMGGIGRMYSKYLVQSFGAKVALLGRSPIDAEKESFIKELNKIGGNAIYVNADSTNFDSLKTAFNLINQKYGEIDHVIHSALVLNDQLIYDMSKEDFISTTSSKIDTTVNLARIMLEYNIKNFLCFSSISSIIKAAGQCNYAAGCCFQESFCNYLLDTTDVNVKVVNWGYWGEIGIVANERYNNSMRNVGMYSISADVAFDFLNYFVPSEKNQLILFRSDKKFLNGFIDDNKKQTLISSTKTSIDINKIMSSVSGKIKSINVRLKKEFVSDKIKGIVSEILNINQNDIDETVSIDELFGDLLLLKRFMTSLNEEFKAKIDFDDIQNKTLSELYNYLK